MITPVYLGLLKRATKLIIQLTSKMQGRAKRFLQSQAFSHPTVLFKSFPTI